MDVVGEGAPDGVVCIGLGLEDITCLRVPEQAQTVALLGAEYLAGVEGGVVGWTADEGKGDGVAVVGALMCKAVTCDVR